MSDKICKFFVKNNCIHGDKCTFIHEKNICRNYFFDCTCNRGDSCKFIHKYKLNEKNNNNINTNKNDNNINTNKNTNNNDNNININKNNKKYNNTDTNKNIKNKYNKRKPKNTTDFTPNHEPLDMNIIVFSSTRVPENSVFTSELRSSVNSSLSPLHSDKFIVNKSLTQYKDNDVIIVPKFLEESYNGELYDRLLQELNDLKIDDNKLWLEWHGENHLIANDSLHWKEHVTTFNFIIGEIERYFNMKVRSTRFNLYEDSTDWKPYHHDAAAIKEHIAEVQNFTVGVSLGATRDISFQHAKTNTTVSIPLENCSAYAFSKKINVDWKHGIPQVHPNKAFNKGRISIIAWGKVNLDD